MGTKIKVQIDADLVTKMRAKAIADGLPNARDIPEERLLSALIEAYLAEEAPVITTTAETVWVSSEDGLNLRAQPVSGQVKRVLAFREKLTVLDQREGWLEVRASDSLTGWVSAEFVTDQAPTAAKTVWVSSEDGLNLRAQPVSGQVKRVLAFREKLTVLDQREGWLEVRASDGLTGWVSAEFVTDQAPTPLPPKGIVRGIHGSAGTVAPPRHLWDDWIDELRAMGVAWYKQLDAGDPNDVGGNSTLAWARRLKQNGIEPIIRYYQGQMFPGRLNEDAFEKMQRYAAEGIVWCEIGNEPNLDEAEWHSSHHGRVSWQNPFYPRTIVENWIKDAEKAVAAGARPGFYALAPTDWNGGQHPQLSSVMFYRRMFEHVAANGHLRQRFRRLFEPGKAWLAVHVSTYEFPVDFDPFPPGQPPHDMCLRGYEVPLRYMRDLLNITELMVISTEGGVFTKDSSSMNGHARLESHQAHAERTVEMFQWLQEQSPLYGMCPWLICNVFESIGHSDPAWAHDGWYDGPPPDFRPKPVVRAMKQTNPSG